jgi:hypothetical protein
MDQTNGAEREKRTMRVPPAGRRSMAKPYDDAAVTDDARRHSLCSPMRG